MRMRKPLAPEGAVAGHDEPIPELETPKQHPAVLPLSITPAQRSTGLALITQVVANPRAEDMSYRAPELNGTANKRITYVSSRTGLVHQGKIAATGA